MALSGEIASLYVRLRPDLRGFATTATTAVKGALAEVQVELGKATSSSVASAGAQVDANRAVVSSIESIKGAAVGEVGALADVKATISETGAVAIATGRANVAAAVSNREANLLLASSYGEVAAKAVAGSEEQRAASKLAADAAQAANAGVVLSAQEVVTQTIREVDENLRLAASYREVAAAAARGSEEQLVASRLSLKSTAEAEAVLGAAAIRARTNNAGLLSSFFGVGGSARGAEKEIGKASRGALAGSGVFASLGRSLAFASGGFLVFASSSRIISDSLKGAASVQKSGEVIRASFGAAAQAVRDFAENGAAKLGISGQVADATSARFGILFKNLGIGQQEAAGMTVGFEKLAGSINAIKGGGAAGAAQVLASITLAAAGNTRGLSQLGVAINGTQIKYAAFKLGLISSIKDAITPAIRAQAIYALATANLPAFLDQARRHSHDLANVQARLSAEWSNAKDKLGNALLPVFTKYTTELANWLGRMNRSGKLQHDFNVVVARAREVITNVADAVRVGWHIFQDAIGWVGGTKHAVELLLGALAVSKFLKIGQSVGGVVSAISGIGKAARIAAVVFGISTAAMDAEAVAASAVMKSALISTGIGAIVVAIGVGVALIITHWDTVKRWLVEFGHWIQAHARQLFFIPIIGPIILLTVEIVRHFDAIKRVVVQVGNWFMTNLLPPIRTAFNGAITVVRAFASFFSTILVHPIRAIENLFHDLRGVINDTFVGLERDALNAALAIVEPFSHLPGFLGGGTFRSLKSWLEGQLADLPGIAQKAAWQTATIFGQTLDLGIAKAVKGVKDPFGVPNASIDTTAADAAIKNGSAWGTNVVKGAVSAITSGTAAITKSTAAATQAAIQASQARIRASVEAAKKNLDSIGQKLAESVNKILDKTGSVAAGLAGSPQMAAFKKLRDLIAGGAGTPEVLRASQQLASEIQAAASRAGGATRQDMIKRQFADLTDEFNKGALSLPAFNRRVAALLAANHISYKQAGKLLGTAFADGYKAQVTGIHEQAAAIAALPAHLRRTGGGGGAADIRIIRPLEVIRRENARIALRAEKQRERNIKASERAAKAAEKANAIQSGINKTKVGALPGHATKGAAHAAKAGIR